MIFQKLERNWNNLIILCKKTGMIFRSSFSMYRIYSIFTAFFSWFEKTQKNEYDISLYHAHFFIYSLCMLILTTTTRLRSDLSLVSLIHLLVQIQCLLPPNQFPFG